MKITLSVESVQPLTGTVAREGREPLRFEGWLELLHAIAAVLGDPRGPDDALGVAAQEGV